MKKKVKIGFPWGKKENKTKKEIKNYKTIQKNLSYFGYSLDKKKYYVYCLLVLLGLGILGWIFKLKIAYVFLLLVVGTFCYPIVVNSYYTANINNKKLMNLTNYMENMIISFKKEPKILLALKNTREYCEGKMRERIEEAIYIIEHDTTEPEIYQKALGVIENEYKTSRLKSLHKSLIMIEKGNSVNYQESLDNLYYDIRTWVTRIFAFQKDLKDRKTKIGISIAASIGIVAYFTKVFVGMGSSIGAASSTDNIIYQLGTLIFLAVLMALYVVVETKLTGVWLVEDLVGYDEKKLLKKLDSVENYDKIKEIKNAIIAAVMIILPFILLSIFLKTSSIRILGILFGAAVLFIGLNTNKSNFNSLKKELIKEFPCWLRDVSVNLQNLVVPKAIEEAYKGSLPITKVFTGRFLKNIENDPISMEPYDNFFGIFKMPELLSSIKSLYAIQSASSDDAIRQVNELTIRNQDLIARAEELKMKDSISGISFLSALPMLALSFKLMSDMVIMITTFSSIM